MLRAIRSGLALLAVASTTAGAQINLPGSTDLTPPFGVGGVTAVGQTFFRGSSTLRTYTFSLRDHSAGAGLSFSTAIAVWTDGRVTSSPLWSSHGNVGTASGSFVDYTWAPNVDLVDGIQYIAYLYNPSAADFIGHTVTLAGAGADVYAGGSFVSTSGPYNQPWAVSEGDAAFRATFTTTAPEPTTWALMGTGLLALGGVAASRRKRAI